MDQWSKHQVAEWISSLGFDFFTEQILENDISGQVLLHANHDLLKELQITSVGQRISILKAIYNLKITQGLPVDFDDYIPETATLEQAPREGWSLNKRKSRLPAEDYVRLENMVKDRDQAITILTREVNRLNTDLSNLKNELAPVWTLVKEYKTFQQKSEQKKKASSSKSSKFSNSSSSPSPPASVINASSSKSPSKTLANQIPSSPSAKRTTSIKPATISSNRALNNQSKMSPIDYVDSPATSVNPLSDNVGAIRIYGDKLLNRENESYKSFRVSMEDTCSTILPTVLKKYKIEADFHNYALFIQHKGQEECLSLNEKPLQYFNSLKDSDGDTVFVLKHIKQVHPTLRNEATAVTNSLPKKLDYSASDSSSRSNLQVSNNGNASRSSSIKTALGSNSTLASGRGGTTSTIVAIYEYKANREDELDVAIGDKFNIINREVGWCFVEKSNGSKGWVPTGCLHESDERDGTGSQNPLKGVGLEDYNKISHNELSIKRGDVLIIHKKFQHWFLAECGTERGWVPSCYVSIESETENELTTFVEEDSEFN
ncbi:Adaptor for signal transduction [Clydaea vesicula]|uniref:Adaptor for signal transduction n=1 Tax=Clydaea vesicula TaxID=447962 RepID=A0AAD5U4V4_9FUNG|nr:Adaptor for signal transduction [Clydaea vesicula]KAJ3384841.1 Adaptor for signal transduction [Lobulomyces angularis]